MENAVEALEMGFAVLVFVIALSLAMTMFTTARQTSEAVLHSSDMLAYVEYVEAEAGTENRVVGLETIIPTLYKYYKENYTVIFRDSSGRFLELYKTKTDPELWSDGYINKYYPGGKSTKICSFDVNEETRRHEPWAGNPVENKKMLNLFITGGDYIYQDSRGTQIIHFGKGLSEYKDKKFIESIGEYSYNADNSEAAEDGEDYNYNTGLIKGRKKRVIIYTIKN